MEQPTVSLIFATLDWTERKALAFVAVRQQIYPEYEVVLSGPSSVIDGVLDPAIKRVPSSADTRAVLVNDGLAAASGELVAVIDPEVIPEPYWLARLAVALSDGDVEKAFGLAACKNGFGVRQSVEIWDGTGRTEDLHFPSEAAVALSPPAGRMPLAAGGNLMMRRDQLAYIGGLDPQIPDPMAMVDLAFRTGGAGAVTAVVPTAIVHLPEDPVPDAGQLEQMGQGLAVFIRRHCAYDMHRQIRDTYRADIREGLVRLMLDGRLSPERIPSFVRRFDAGFERGTHQTLQRTKAIARSAEGFSPYRDRPLTGVRLLTDAQPPSPESECVFVERRPIWWPIPQTLSLNASGRWIHGERRPLVRLKKHGEHAATCPVRSRFGA